MLLADELKCEKERERGREKLGSGGGAPLDSGHLSGLVNLWVTVSVLTSSTAVVTENDKILIS